MVTYDPAAVYEGGFCSLLSLWNENESVKPKR